ncbi:hypothetical protein ACOTVS_11770 [Aliarcobacter butzleri]|uniref:hypothetical protein n=1 Tax=Aliarcobacter butzleri TaxID=28197 RepID=UPI00344DC4D9
MAKTTPITINVFKDCGTCTHICFSENLEIDVPEIAKCEIYNKIVAEEDNKRGIIYCDEDCNEWKFDYELLKEYSHIIDFKKEVFKENLTKEQE